MQIQMLMILLMMARQADGQISIKEDTEVDIDADIDADAYAAEYADDDADDAADGDDTSDADDTSDDTSAPKFGTFPKTPYMDPFQFCSDQLQQKE